MSRRLERGSVKALLDNLVPAMSIHYVDEPFHRNAVSAFLAAGRGGPSLVDWVSFEVMRHGGIERAFAFDRHFSKQGFQVVP